MTDKILVEDLANAPPQHWAEMIARAVVLERFGTGRLSIAAAEAAASALGIKRRRFYKLLAAHRKRRAGGKVVRSMLGCTYSIAPDQEDAISDAFESAGPAARLSDVYRETLRICEVQGVKPPSKRPVQTRFGKTRGIVSLRDRLKTDANIIVDFCRLEVVLEDTDGTAKPAYFWVCIEAASGRVSSHRLFTEPPRKELVVALLDGVIPDARKNWSDPPRILSTAAMEAYPSSDYEAPFGGPAEASIKSRYPASAAIRAVFGDRIGRLSVRSHGTKSPALPDIPAVPINIVSCVLDYLVERRNSDLMFPRMTLNHEVIDPGKNGLE